MTSSDRTDAASPFHAGEQAVQARFGVRDKIEAIGRRVIRPEMPKQHRVFFAQLPFLVLGVKDDEGQPWATLLGGRPGFVTAASSTRLNIGASPCPADPTAPGLAEGRPIALLGIELHSRRRNRANGHVIARNADGFSVAIDQSFGNCPQYIQARNFVSAPAPTPGSTPAAVRQAGLDVTAQQAIAAADTFFIASAHPGNNGAPAEGVDVSHRGGKPGFVKVEDDVLTVPDFLGNYLFNTLGNLLLEPRAGLVFPDFRTSDLIHLAVDTEIIWEGAELDAFAGAERLLKFRVRDMVRVTASLPIREVGVVTPSPFLQRTGSWASADGLKAADWPANVSRPFRIAQIWSESPSVRTLRLDPSDGLGARTYKPGQHLPLRLPASDSGSIRTYTLTGASDGQSYQISVKRQGDVSALLHAAKVGDLIDVFPPRGDFTFDEASNRPAVLISAGIGVTPMIAMLNGLLVNEGRNRHPNRIWFIHGARNGADHPFAAFVRSKVAAHRDLTAHVAYSDPREIDRLGQDYQSRGRIDRDLLRSILPLDDYDFYICGPATFMGDLHRALRGLGVRSERIRTEAFGPSSLPRAAPPDMDPATPSASEAGVLVEFRRSGDQTMWRPSDGTLLDLAERQGLMPPHACRAGICGTCAVQLWSGAVDYAEPPAAELAAGQVLICCARPQSSHTGPTQTTPALLSIDL